MTKHLRRRQAVAAMTATAAVLALGMSYTSAAGAAPAKGTSASAVPANLKLIKTKTSLLGKHYWYQQTFKGLPVINGYYAQHVDKSGKVTQVNDGRDAVPDSLDVSAKVPAATATKSANAVVTARARIAKPNKNSTPAPAAGQGAAQLAVIGGANARLVWNVTSRSADGVSRSLVDAKSGAVVDSKVISDNVDGTGSVFDPNPSVTLKNENLTDQDDKNQPILFTAEKNVILRNLDGSGKLNGKYVNIAEAKGGVAYEQEQQVRLPARQRQVRAGDGVLRRSTRPRSTSTRSASPR